jgi:hypothetical protein
VNAQFHVMPQEHSTQPADNVNVQPIKKVLEESGVTLINHVPAHQNSHFGTVNIALFVQLEQHLILNNINAITAQKDLLEIQTATAVFHHFENDRFIQLFVLNSS